MKKSWLGAAGSTALLFGLFACSGESGTDGIDGKDGVNGIDGKDGESCIVETLKNSAGYKVLCDGDSVGVLLNGIDGKDGSDGKNGKDGVNGKDGKDGVNGKDGLNGADGESCLVSALTSKDGYKVLCGGDSVGVLLNGAAGENCLTTDADDGVAITCGANTVIVKDGKSCSATENASKTGFVLSCGGEVVGTILNGTNGTNGTNGINGASCSAVENAAKTGFTLTCDGVEVGTILNGKNGTDGTNCSAVENDDKTGFVLSCGGQTIGTILNGKDGKDGTSCTAVQNAAKTGYTLSCGGEVVGDILNGQNGLNGKDGANCSAVENEKKTGFVLSCDGKEVGTILNGSNGNNGTSCSAVEKADHSGYIMSCGGAVVGEISNGRSCTAVPYSGEDGTGYTVTCGDVSGNILNGEKGDACVAENYSGADGSGFVIKCGGKEAGKILNGSNGTNCTAVKNADGNFELSCAGTGVGTITNGKDGVGCTLVDNGNGTATQTCGETSITLYKAMCGTTPYDPALSFCKDGTVIGYCGGEAYDPAVKFCNSNNELADLCNGKRYEADQKCEENVILTKCGNATNFWYYDSTQYFCANSDFVGQDVVVGKCGGEKFNPSTETCDATRLTIKPFCGGTFSGDGADISEVATAICQSGSTFLTASNVGTCAALGQPEIMMFFKGSGSAMYTKYNPNTQFCQVATDGTQTIKKLCGAEKKTFTEGQFCSDVDNDVHDLCGTSTYNPTTEFCDAGTVRTLCNGNTFDGTTQKCEDDVIVTLCGAASLEQYYDSTKYFCTTDGKVFNKCNGESYNPSEKVCSANTLYDYCGTASARLLKTNYDKSVKFTYNLNEDKTVIRSSGLTYIAEMPLKTSLTNYYLLKKFTYANDNQFCYEGTVVSKCGGESYNPSTEFCDDGTVRTLCGGYAYANASQFCLENKVYERCGTENNGEYDPTTTTCVDQVQKPWCGLNYTEAISTQGSTVEECRTAAIANGFTWYGETAKKGYQTCFLDQMNSTTYVVACPRAYDPAEQFCSASKAIYNRCGTEKLEYDPNKEFCDVNGMVLKWCGDKKYDGANEFCDFRDKTIYPTISFYSSVTRVTYRWMARNLNYEAEGSYCLENTTYNCYKDYNGRLYDWTTAMQIDSKYATEYAGSAITEQHQGVCPDGWHIPSEPEAILLRSRWCSDSELSDCSWKFKTADETMWPAATYHGTAIKAGAGTSGFNTIRSGLYTSATGTDNTGTFMMWIADDNIVNPSEYLNAPDPTKAYRFQTHMYSNEFGENSNPKADRLSIRCVKNY